ncbi:MAG TPA: hypothetical protein VLT32_13750 [Candidatus Sulfomarinibacteraceae bacterium]|nr:hypothetical protein [Candidatus Sulfomarinibacteraceae bacterium]
MSGSTDRPAMLELERDLPTTAEDVEALRRLAGRMVVTEPADANRLRDPFWTLERALVSRFFRDTDQPFEL